MVKVTSYKEVAKKDGSSFISLELIGGLELVQSQSTGNYYACVRKCSIPSTFDKSIAKSMIGETVEGEIVRISVEPYEYLNKNTGELMMLQHSYAYRPKGAVELIGETQVQELEAA